MDGVARTVLIVGDEGTRAELIGAMGEGWVVEECGEGEEGRRRVGSGVKYACVFWGEEFGEVGGEVVMVVGDGEQVPAGAVDYLEKGRITRELVGRVMRYAGGLREARERQWVSEERFKRLAEVAEDGVWIVDAGGVTTFVNAGAAAMIGYRPEELVGRTPLEFMDGASGAATLEALGRRRQGFRERRDCVMLHRDGTQVWTIIAAAPLSGPGGEYQGAFAVLTDVSRERRTEQALKESEDRFRKIFEEGPLGMAVVELDRRIVATNEAFARMLGRERRELVGMRFEEITHPDDRAEDVDLAERLVRGEIPSYRLEKRYLRADGGVVWGALSVSLIKDAGGRPAYGLGMVEDITDRRRAEEELKASEGRFRSLFESSPVAIALSIGGVTRYANPAYLRQFGYDRAEEVIGRPLLQQVAPSMREMIAARVVRRMKGEPEPVSYEAVGVRRDGTEFPYHVRVTRMELPDGVGNLVFVTDLTERRRQERELVETSQTLEAVFAASPVAVAVLDRTGVVRMWNPAAERMFGWTRREAVGRLFPLVVEAGGTGQFDALREQLLGGRAFEGLEGSQRRKDGTAIDVSVSAAPLVAGEGEVTGIVVVCADMTEGNRLRDRLAQAQKMESLGRLAGGIAHDFNNLLAVIGGYAESARRRVGEGHPARPQVEEIERAAERGARLVKQLLTFSRSRPLKTERVDLAATVVGVCEMLGQVIGRGIVIDRRGEGPAWVEADPGQMEQMLVNLALNARDAMAGSGGTLTVETGHARDGRVRLVVSDTGVGMDAATRARVFEPFFTTKAEGTGLGLSIVYGIVREQGGEVSVASEAGEGTRFEVLLPGG